MKPKHSDIKRAEARHYLAELASIAAEGTADETTADAIADEAYHAVRAVRAAYRHACRARRLDKGRK